MVAVAVDVDTSMDSAGDFDFVITVAADPLDANGIILMELELLALTTIIDDLPMTKRNARSPPCLRLVGLIIICSHPLLSLSKDEDGDDDFYFEVEHRQGNGKAVTDLVRTLLLEEEEGLMVVSVRRRALVQDTFFFERRESFT